MSAVEQMQAVLLAYERWEADVILDPDCWRTSDGVHVTQPHYDRLMEIQAMRNEALAAVAEAELSSERTQIARGNR